MRRVNRAINTLDIRDDSSLNPDVMSSLDVCVRNSKYFDVSDDFFEVNIRNNHILLWSREMQARSEFGVLL